MLFGKNLYQDQEIKMRLKGWQILLYAIASVLYIIEYLFILVTSVSQVDYKYSLLDNIYFQWQCLVYLLLFISIFHSFRHHAKIDRVIIFSALSVSVIRFITQGLEGLKLINGGEIKIIIIKFFVLVLSIVIYTTHNKLILWYRKLRS